MGLSVDIVKRGNRRKTEQFTHSKLHASLVAACLSVNTPDGQAESIAALVCDAVIKWLEFRPEVTSQDIRRIATKHLNQYHPEAAYLYEHHRIII